VLFFVEGSADPDRFLSALRFHLSTSFESDSFLDDSVFRYARQAARSARFTGRERSRQLERVARTPFPYACLHWLRTDLWPRGIDERMTYLGAALAYTLMLRVSEYAMTGNGVTHALLSDDVVFTLDDFTQYFSWQIPDHSEVQMGRIRSVSLSLRTSKTHRFGRLRLETLTRGSAAESQFLEDLFSFASEAHSLPTDIFFSRRRQGRQKHLTDSMIKRALRQAALAFNIPPEGISSHSLRIGGATDLSVAGWEDRAVASLGHWNSGASRIYQRPTEQHPNPLRVGSAGEGTTPDIIRATRRPVIPERS
jgi:hypothetical protein